MLTSDTGRSLIEVGTPGALLHFQTRDGRRFALPNPARGHDGMRFAGMYDDDDDGWDDDVSDDDVAEIYGMEVYAAAKKAKQRGHKNPLKKLKMAALARQAGGFSMPSPQRGYGMVLPIPFSFTLNAGQTDTISIQPQNRIRVQELTLASPNARDLAISAFRVGTDDQWAGSNGLWNGDLLSSQSPRVVSLRGSVAAPGIIIKLSVENLSSEARTFYGHLLGPAVRQGGGIAG